METDLQKTLNQTYVSSSHFLSSLPEKQAISITHSALEAISWANEKWINILTSQPQSKSGWEDSIVTLWCQQHGN